MITKLDGVAFPENVYNYFFTCGGGSSGGSASCSPYDQPHYYPDPTQPADNSNCPAVVYPPGGGICVNYPGLTEYPVGWLRHYAKYTPTGSTTVPLSVTFNGMADWLGMTGGVNPEVTLNVDLETGSVTPVAPYDLVIHDIVDNCIIFNPNWYSEPAKICFAVEVKPILKYLVPWHIQTLLYLPPFNQSNAKYGLESTIGTKETWTWKTSTGSVVSFEFDYEGLEIMHGNFTTTAGIIGTKSVISTASGGYTFTNYQEKEPCNDASCDFSNDPNHDNDMFQLQLEMICTGFEGGERTLDVSSGTPVQLRVGDLKKIVQGDYSAVDPLIRSMVEEYIKPSDAQQILDVDPYISGMAIDQHPERFEPACVTPGPCPVPHQVLIQWNTADGSSSSVTLSHVYGSGNEVGSGTTSAEETNTFFLPYGEEVAITTYEDITTTSDFTSRSAEVTFKNTSRCESGTVDLWLDKAFGTLLWVTNIQNSCAVLPMRSMSFESPADWQIEGGTATLDDSAVTGGHSLAVSANGLTQLTSIPLSSELLRGVVTSADLSKVSFALNIPTQQPNPLSIGTARMFISSPSAGVSDVGMGEVELTGLPQGQFVRLGFAIPDSALPALTQDNPDVTFTIVLNVNPGTSGWLVDDLQIGCSTCGACAPTCAPGTVCTSGAECASLVCTIDTEHSPYGTCQACSPTCGVGAACASGSDCVTGICTAGVCAVDPCAPGNDAMPPVFTAKPGNVASDPCGAVISIGNAEATDNCPGTVTITNDAPASYPVGVTIVTWTATDVQGNQNTYQQTVTVTSDTGLPTFTSTPPNVVTTVCAGVPSIGTATASDSCGSVVVTNNAPATFPIGTTTVTWTATDTAGNQKTYQQTVKVNAALDLGFEHAVSSVANNACLKVTKYPSWAPYMHSIILQPQATGVGFPIPFTWKNCGASGSGSLPAPWLQGTVAPMNTACQTLIKLGGNGAGNVSLTWWGNG